MAFIHISLKQYKTYPLLKIFCGSSNKQDYQFFNFLLASGHLARQSPWRVTTLLLTGCLLTSEIFSMAKHLNLPEEMSAKSTGYKENVALKQSSVLPQFSLGHHQRFLFCADCNSRISGLKTNRKTKHNPMLWFSYLYKTEISVDHVKFPQVQFWSQSLPSTCQYT